MRRFFKRDSYWLGIGIAIVLPCIIFSIIKLIDYLLGGVEVLKDSTTQLVAVFMNLFPFRYYLIKVKADKTGRGILIVTFILAIVYFYFNINL